MIALSRRSVTARNRSASTSMLGPRVGAAPIGPDGMTPGGEVYTDSKGRLWMLISTPKGVVGVSQDANAELIAKDRAELIADIEKLTTTGGYLKLAMIGGGIVVGLWLFFRTITP